MPLFLFKAVKPSKMKVDAFRLSFLSATHKAEREIKKDFQLTTKSWNHQPVFESAVSLQGGPQVLVGTDDQVYGWVDNGTAPHVISGNPMLVYKTTFISKTLPGVIGSRAGGKFGRYTKRKVVSHPGIEPRNFTKEIAKQWKPKFKKMMEDAMRDVVTKSGYKA